MIFYKSRPKKYLILQGNVPLKMSILSKMLGTVTLSHKQGEQIIYPKSLFDSLDIICV